MRISNNLSRIMGILTVLFATSAGAYPGENIALDPVSGNYVITYWDESTEDSNGNPIQPSLMQTTFVPATKVIPSIRSKFWQDGTVYVRYGYTLFNDNTAKQSIVRISLEQVGHVANEQDVLTASATENELENAIYSNMSALDSPEDWSGNIYRSQSRIVWRSDDLEAGGVRPGRVQSGFGFRSSVLPGISEARMKGIGAVFGYAGGGPSEDSAIFEKVTQLQNNNFIARNVAVPAVLVPVPFDAAVLLDRIRTQVDIWPSKQLLDSTFATQLDRYLVAAANAYRLNQPKAGKDNIEIMRKLLAHEHQNLDHDDEDGEDTADHKAATRLTIDRLAARVLDFDLRYVLNRTEHEESESRKAR